MQAPTTSALNHLNKENVLELPANQSGMPMTYSINGKQYIVVAVGANGHAGELVALTLE